MLSHDDANFVMTQVRAMAVEFARDYNVMFNFTEDMSVGYGGMRRFKSISAYDTALTKSVEGDGTSSDGSVIWLSDSRFDGVQPDYVVDIGVKDLWSTKGHMLLTRDVALGVVTMALMHEMRHVEQYEVAKGHVPKPQDMPREVLWSLVASCDNKDYF